VASQKSTGADGKHQQSGTHFIRAEEGLTDKPTKKNLMAFWGDALPNMPRVGGGIFVI
jgi:hypothetical protein